MKKALLIGLPLLAVAIVVAAAFAFRFTQLSRASDTPAEFPKPYDFTSKKPVSGGFGRVPVVIPQTTPAPGVSTGDAQGDALLKTLNSTNETGTASDFTGVEQDVSQL